MMRVTTEHFICWEDENFITKTIWNFVKTSGKDAFHSSSRRQEKEEVMSMNWSVNYFAKNDQFEETNSLKWSIRIILI
jgi:hypothetical protein